MKSKWFNRRGAIALLCAMALSGCQLIPKTGPATSGPGPDDGAPRAGALPSDTTHHKIALLVPLSGKTGAVGQSIANAATMAVLDTNANNLRITNYDTAKGAGQAAAEAIAQGNQLILGPLLARNVNAVRQANRRARLPIIAFSNDSQVASQDVFLLGHIPEQSIARSVRHVVKQGKRRFAVLAPDGDYGDRAVRALDNALRADGGALVAIERFQRGNPSVIGAAARLAAKAPFEAVLIASTSSNAVLAARELRKTRPQVQIVGTELWSGESRILRESAMEGAIFSAVSDQRFARFSDSYFSRFGARPYRVSTLGYDAVLLTLRIARDWPLGRPFPKQKLLDPGGFLGLDGPFRFRPSGMIERAMEVRAVREGRIAIVDPAPTRFAN